MKKRFARFAFVIALIMLLPQSIYAQDTSVSRIAGKSRYETSAYVSQMAFKQAKSIVIASGEGFADALAGGGLASAVGGPLLLVEKNQVPQVIMEEITRLQPKTIYLLGGENTISPFVEEIFADYSIERISGIDRYDTSIQIAKKVVEIAQPDTLLFANGNGFADALAAGGYLAHKGGALILTDGQTLPEGWDELSTEQNLVLGGERSVSTEIEEMLGAERIAGSTREETALAIAQKTFDSIGNAILVDGHNFPDGLCAVGLAKANHAPILLASKDTMADSVYEAVSNQHVTIIGGENSISRRVVNKLLGIVEPEPPKEQPEGPKTIYLTFDDGPGPHTKRLLDLFDKYNVKATFFVLGRGPELNGLIKRAHDAGHSIGAHAYNHDYYSIYASSTAFWNDNARIAEIIKAQTGAYPTMMRFPGGSSNTVSRFNPGIMSRLTKEAGERGYVYFDWNVDSNDAGGTTSSAGVRNNIIRGVQRHNISVVLCHDVKGYTVDAMEDVIRWGLDNGYTFRALTPNSTAPHQPIAN